MKKALLISIFLPGFFLLPQIQAADQFDGEWLGGVVYKHGESCPGHWNPIKIHFRKDNNETKASIDYPKENQFDLAMEFDAEKLTFERTNPNGIKTVLQGQIHEGKIVGAYIQDGHELGAFQLFRNPGRVVKHRPLPDFKLSLLDNSTLSKSDLFGKFYLIDFWFTGCKICTEEMPNLHEAFEKYKDKNFTILSVSIDQNLEDLLKFRKEQWAMPWPNAHLKGSWDSPMLKEFDFKGSPTLYLVSPEGRVLAGTEQLLGENLEKTLAKFLN